MTINDTDSTTDTTTADAGTEDPSTWTGKVVAITGGNSGIGRAVARQLGARGAHVAILGRDRATVCETRHELPDALALVGDVRSADDLDRWYAAIADRWGGVDALVVNASVGILGPMETFELADVRTSLDVNVIGAYLTVQRAVRHLRDGSTVVFVTSANAELAQPGSSAYAATKAAQGSMIKVFAAELLPRGVRVNGVRPGPVDTPMWTRLGLPADELAATKAAVASAVPMGRFADPVEVANAIAFLAGPESSFVVGEELAVDGGITRL